MREKVYFLYGGDRADASMLEMARMTQELGTSVDEVRDEGATHSARTWSGPRGAR